MDIDFAEVLLEVLDRRASDLHLTAGAPPMSVEIIYETHSTSVDNETGIATGWLPGELSKIGRQQATQLGARRRTDGIAAVFTSDLQRDVAPCDRLEPVELDEDAVLPRHERAEAVDPIEVGDDFQGNTGVVVDDFHWMPEGLAKVEPNPARREMVWFADRVTVEDGTGVANRDGFILPTGSGRTSDRIDRLPRCPSGNGCGIRIHGSGNA